MNKAQFVVGQRWISEAEPELGLGIVLELPARRITLSFPAAGERRTYAVDNAPVSRVVYQVGERVKHHGGTAVKITQVIEQQGCLLYTGITAEKEELIFPEFELDSFVQFSTPRDRLFAGQIDKLSHFNLRYRTLSYLNRQNQSPVLGLAGPRVQLLPHQLYIASEVSSRYAPRVLLADEVGLGKTIEAGLILHQQLMTGQVKRALIVVPASLQHQWLVEMLRRFNLAFTLLDEARCNALVGLDKDEISVDFIDDFEDDLQQESGEVSDNPFESAQLILCSLDFLTRYPERQQQAIDAGWDLLLVDEAHHLLWSEDNVSNEYRAIEALSKVSKGLLLLTATPEQLGIESHFARLRLLDPDRYYNLQEFIDEQQVYQPLNDVVQALLTLAASDQPALPDALLASLSAYLPDEALVPLRESKGADLVNAIDDTITALLDRHGTGRVLFRNTRNSVTGFPARELHCHELPLSEEELEAFTANELAVQICAEDFWGERASNGWWLEDPRVTWLAEWLRANRRKKVLIICKSAETAESLEDYLRLRKGVLSGLFHEGLSLIERDRAAAYFADLEEGAQVLVCSEIGSEGRNFQFAHDLVMFDLPLNPDLLEQRIGRLDRIGQTETVCIHVPYHPATAQQRLLDFYHQGLNAFEKTCAIGQAVTSELGSNTINTLAELSAIEFNQLLEKTQALSLMLVEKMQKGRDRLLELNSCKPEKAAAIVEALADQEADDELSRYLDRVFDAFGVDSERHSEQAVILHPGDHMRVPHFPGLPEGGVTVTFDREQALSREDMQFMTWEHPLVRGAQELIVLSEFGNTTFCTLKLPPLKPGMLMLEALYVLHCSAPAEWQISRYIPQSLVRILLDNNGKDLSAVLSVEQLTKLVQKTARSNAQEIVRHARSTLAPMLKSAEEKTLSKQDELILAAKEKLNTELTQELARMEALRKVNPNVRQVEIDALKNRLTVCEQYLSQARLRLDSLRIIMTI